MHEVTKFGTSQCEVKNFNNYIIAGRQDSEIFHRTGLGKFISYRLRCGTLNCLRKARKFTNALQFWKIQFRSDLLHHDKKRTFDWFYAILTYISQK